MTLPISDIVQVDISVAPSAAPLAGFGELLFMTSESGVISPAERVRKYTSLAGVQADWGANTQVVAAATAFYAQTPQPIDFTVGIVATAPYAATLIGGVHGTIAELQAVSGGAFSIDIDGSTVNPTGIDLSGAADLAGVATLMQTALDTELTGTQCAYENGRFKITSPTTGTSSTIGYASAGADNLDGLLGLRQADAGIIDNGADGETPVTALGEVVQVTSSFVAVCMHNTYRDNPGVPDIGDWCEANKKLFMNTTNDIAVQNSTSAAGSIAGQLKDKALRYTITTFGVDAAQYPSASLFGRIATVNYEGSNTTITLKFKRLPTITVSNITPNAKAAMDSINVGAFLDFGGTLMYAESRMADGGWLDSVHGLLWLENRIQIGVFNLLFQSTTKIPYTDTGVNMVVGRVVSALQQGVTNGLLAPGTTTNDEYLEFGYKVTAMPVSQVPNADKSNRIYRGITFECVGAGALHNVVISGSFNE